MTDNEIIQAWDLCLSGKVKACNECPYCTAGCIDDLHRDSASLIKRQQAEIERLQDRLSDKTSEWISVEDRLPENDAMVIGYTPCDGFMFVGYYHEEPKYDWKVWRIVTAMRSTKIMTKKVTHWMPLQPAPKDMK